MNLQPVQCAATLPAYLEQEAWQEEPPPVPVPVPPKPLEVREAPYAAVLRTLDLLCPDAPVELRVKQPGEGIEVKRFTSHDKAAEWVLSIADAAAVYVLMNPHDPQKEIKPGCAATDDDIIRRRWLLVDADPKRDAETNSSDEELQRAGEVIGQVKDYLAAEGKWTEPIEADSGNGKHLLYQIDLPNDTASKTAVKNLLNYLHQKFSTEDVTIDTKVFNASRITKLYGTVARKGPASAERPHRRSRITRIPETLRVVPTFHLRRVSTLTVAPAEAFVSGKAPTPPTAKAEPLPGEIKSGSRNNVLFTEGCRLRRLGWNEAEILAALRTLNGTRCKPALSDTEVASTARSCARYEAAQDLFPCTEAGDAEFFAACNADGLRFNHRTREWLLFREHFWAAQSDGEVHRLALQTIRARQAAAVKSTGDGRAERINWAIRGEARKRLVNQLALAENLRPLADPGDQWDREPHLLGVQNGVIDLRTGALRHGEPEDRITLVSPLNYDAAAPTAKWEQFILDVSAGDEELAAYLQAIFGYALTGETHEQCFWIFHGEGSNGKSTLLEMLTQRVMPNHSWTMKFPSSAWSEAMSDYNKAQLVGRRLIVSKENERAQTLNAGFVKSLTGDEQIEARHPYGRPFQFAPVAKFVLGVNHKPRITDDSHGMWRRVRLVPFLRTFELNPAFAESLIAEAPGVLAWAVRGAVRYYREGMSTPASVLVATKNYQNESDTLGQFFADRCIFGADKRARAQQMYDALRDWYDVQQTPHFERLNQNELGKRIAADPRIVVANGKGTERKVVFYNGVGLLEVGSL